MTSTAQRGADLPASSDLATRAKTLVALLDEHADYADEQGRLHQDVVDAFHRERLFLMWVPKELGGSELNPVESLDVLANVVVRRCLGRLGADGRQPVDRYRCRLPRRLRGRRDVRRRPVAGDRRAGHPARYGLRSTAGTCCQRIVELRLRPQHGTHIHTLGIIEETGEPRIFVSRWSRPSCSSTTGT